MQRSRTAYHIAKTSSQSNSVVDDAFELGRKWQTVMEIRCIEGAVYGWEIINVSRRCCVFRWDGRRGGVAYIYRHAHLPRLPKRGG
jgi:hypothetical protein